MIALIAFQVLVVGLLVLGGGIPKSPIRRSHLQVTINPFHLGCVEGRDKTNPLKSPLAVAIEELLRINNIRPLYIVAGANEVRVALRDRTLIYRPSPVFGRFLKAYHANKPVGEITTTLKLIEVKHDGIPPLRRLLNLIPV